MALTVAEASQSEPTVLGYFTELTDIALRTQTEVQRGIFMAEGEVTIRRALHHGHRMLAIMAEPRWLEALKDVLPDDARVIMDDQNRLAEVSGFVIHRGAIAAFQRPPVQTAVDVIANADRLLFLEGLVNHTNVGAIFRSAAAMRFDGVLIGPQCADPLYRRSIRTSMGAVFTLPWARAQWREFVQLTEEWDRVALTPSVDAIDIREWRPGRRTVLMIGTEAEGLSQLALDSATVRARIPMAEGIDSLNAAAATAVACYELTRGHP